MSIAGAVIGFVDFETELSLYDIADVLSSKAFGGIHFVEKDVDGEHDLGTLTLEYEFLGIQVDLVGANGTYTLEVATTGKSSVVHCPEVCDLSRMLQQCLSQIVDVSVKIV